MPPVLTGGFLRKKSKNISELLQYVEDFGILSIMPNDKKMARAVGLSLWVVAVGLLPAGCATYSGPAAMVQTEPKFGLTAFSQLVFNQTGVLLAAYDAMSGQIKIYRTENLSLMTSWKIKMNQSNSMIFSPDGKYLAIDSTNRRNIEIRELDSGKTAATLPFDERKIMAYLFSPDSKIFSILCDDGTILRWDTQDWTQMPDKPAPSFWSKIGASEYTHSVFPDDGNLVMVQGKENLWLWNLLNDSVSAIPNPFGKVNAITVSRDFKRIAGTCRKNLGFLFLVHAWDISTGQPIPLEDSEFWLCATVLAVNWHDTSSLTFSPDGTLLAATLVSHGGLRRSPESRIWRLDTGAVVWTLPSNVVDWWGQPLAFSPDGELLAVGRGSIRLFRVKDILSQGEHR
jgi:WD40 repeat protein